MRFNIPNEKDTIMDKFQNAPRPIYQGGLGAIAGNTPRKIGIIDRVHGINGGLSDLYGRLISLIDRVEGNEPFGTKLSPVPSVGLAGVLSDAEGNLRGCMELINQLNAKF